jgi:hypothetical protein
MATRAPPGSCPRDRSPAMGCSALRGDGRQVGSVRCTGRKAAPEVRVGPPADLPAERPAGLPLRLLRAAGRLTPCRSVHHSMPFRSQVGRRWGSRAPARRTHRRRTDRAAPGGSAPSATTSGRRPVTRECRIRKNTVSRCRQIGTPCALRVGPSSATVAERRLFPVLMRGPPSVEPRCGCTDPHRLLTRLMGERPPMPTCGRSRL